MALEIIAEKRAEQGTGASRRQRRAGKVPGILYGTNKDAVAILLDHNTLYYALQKENFHASVLSLKIDGKEEKALLRDTQYHPWKKQVMHVDFQRVNAKEKIHIHVPFHFLNADIAPGVKKGGGIVSHVLTEVEISCLPKHLPEFIEVDLQGLEMGHSLHLEDVKLPDGVEFVALRHNDNATVATIMAVRGGEEAAEKAPDEAAAPTSTATPKAEEKPEAK